MGCQAPPYQFLLVATFDRRDSWWYFAGFPWGACFFLLLLRTKITRVSELFYKTKHLVKHHWLTIAFVAGFATDFLLLNQVDNKFDNLVLLFYVVLATFSLVLFYLATTRKGPIWFSQFLTWSTPLVMQYSFGGLLSGMLIFYGRSGDFIVSAPFLLVILSVVFANEFVKKLSSRLLYNVTLYFIGIYSYCILVVPVWLGKMGDLVFIGSGLLALAIIIFLIKLLKQVVPNYVTIEKRALVFSIGVTYALFNAFYFLNIIPPIPLSLTQLGIYQSVERDSGGGTYHIIKEDRPWYQKIPWYPLTVHPMAGSGLSCFARVYAPLSLHTSVMQRWEFQDQAGVWQQYYSKSYEITGENRNGYGGYTTITGVFNGRWRCTVENERGQVLGRRTFTIDMTKKPKGLVTVVE